MAARGTDEGGDVRQHLVHPRQPLDAVLVHVQRALDLDLQGVDTGLGAAVVAGGEAAGIGVVAADAIARLGQNVLGGIGHGLGATGAEAVAQHHVGTLVPRVPVHGPAKGRHRMAINQDRRGEAFDGERQQVLNGFVEWDVEVLDPALGLGEFEFALINLGAVGDHPGDGAQAPRHLQR